MLYRRKTRPSDVQGTIYAGGYPLPCQREADGFTYVQDIARHTVKVDMLRIGFSPAPIQADAGPMELSELELAVPPASVEPVAEDTEEQLISLGEAVRVPAGHLIPAIKDGQFDFDLAALIVAEEDYRGRPSVLRAITRRLDELIA